MTAGLVCWIVVTSNVLLAADKDIPKLSWTQRSDWINVKSDISPAAVGDGKSDDTAAIQAALDKPGDGLAVYLPAGTYRITKTLVLTGPRIGCLVVGHGRDTKIVWEGLPMKQMFLSQGAAYTRYIGLSWDGAGKAYVGVDHASTKRFETQVRHEHEAFRNFTGVGIRVGNEQKVASAEVLYHNCLFDACKTGLSFLAFNDYNNTIDGCEFRNCGTGIHDHKANFYARNCHFENSRETDISIGSEHSSSIRRCTSIGSAQFIENRGGIAPVTIQDCQVQSWTGSKGAILLNGAPAMLFDCTFTHGPDNKPPVARPKDSQPLIVSNNLPDDVDHLITPRPTKDFYEVPKGKIKPTLTSANTSFLKTTVAESGKVFDARRDFGAKGDGLRDDTAAIAAAIDAARQAGNNAVAYLPKGNFVVSRTLSVTGSNYQITGSGFKTDLVWKGADDQPILDVDGVRDVRFANLSISSQGTPVMKHGADIAVACSDGRPCHLTIDEVYVYGKYQKDPDRHGIRFRDLPADSVIDAIHLQGNISIKGSDRAKFLFRNSYEGTVTLEGATKSRDGIVGFMTRLATIAKPALQIRDNRSIVLSDFYVEQCDQLGEFSGEKNQTKGTITIQGAKVGLETDGPVVDVQGYDGQIYIGQDQFYVLPKVMEFSGSCPETLRVIFAGNFWYNTKPQFSWKPKPKVTLIGNWTMADENASRDAIVGISAALDDLRRLGQLDRSLSGTSTSKERSRGSSK